jgi:hypothetical protein
MRKTINRIPREDKNSATLSTTSGKRFGTAKYDVARIPVFTVVDDEEYFFEVEDV